MKLCNLQDIPEGGSITVDIGDEDIALFKIEGKVYALAGSCPHMGGPLGEGELEDDIVTCPWHGWQFCVKDGACLNVPGDDAATRPITIKNDEVWLEESLQND
jgi:nitrite reductase/ring-hydroxylating ferredoxin subunit